MSLRRAPPIVFLFVASLARAQGPAAELTLHRAHVNGETVLTVAQGSVVTFEGTGLHECPPEPKPGRTTCRHDDLRVAIGSMDAFIAACTSESVTVILPFDAPLGDQQVRVTVRDGRQLRTATVVLNVRPERSSGRTEPWPLPFVIEHFVLTRAPDGARFEVVGQVGEVGGPRARRHEGVLWITLALDDRVVAHQELTFDRRGDFEVVFGPFTREVLAGSYSIDGLLRVLGVETE